MSGQLQGEILRNSDQLGRLGVKLEHRVIMLVIADECRDERHRTGIALLPYLAMVTGKGERTVTRLLADLRRWQLVTVARRGGGRGHEKRPTLYRLANLRDWLTERGATWVASQYDAVHGLTRHDGGDSIDQRQRIDSPPGGDSIPIDSPSAVDSLAKSERLTRHPGGDLYRSAVTDRGGTTDVTTGPPAPSPERAPAAVSAPAVRQSPFAPPAPAPAPRRPSPRPRTATPPAAAPAGRSLCAEPSCPGLRGDRACRRCGEVRRAADAAEAARLRAIRDQREAEDHAADNPCPWACVDGLRIDLASRLPVECDHRPQPRQWVAETMRSALPRGRPSTRLPRRAGRHAAPEPAAAGEPARARDPADPPDTGSGAVIAS